MTERTDEETERDMKQYETKIVKKDEKNRIEDNIFSKKKKGTKTKGRKKGDEGINLERKSRTFDIKMFELLFILPRSEITYDMAFIIF